MSDCLFSDVHTFSIERLLRLAFHSGLITDYCMSPRSVQLKEASSMRELDPEEARRYLADLLQHHRL